MLCCVQAAKSVGQTLRAFQPTIREVVEASQEIKGTLEQVRPLNNVMSCHFSGAVDSPVDSHCPSSHHCNRAEPAAQHHQSY